MTKKEVVVCYLGMKKVLEFYAERENYSVEVEEDMSRVRADGGKKARDILTLCGSASKRILQPESRLQK